MAGGLCEIVRFPEAGAADAGRSRTRSGNFLVTGAKANAIGLMNTIQIEVWDATGNKRQTVEVPADAAVNRVIAVLVDKMNLPRHSPDGQLMSYKFHHKGSGRQLMEDETLASAGVRAGDVLRLQPEITAGARRQMFRGTPV